jgi:CheY-like chemotaxis protein
MNALKVLCVENHPGYMATLTNMLEGVGCEVIAASSSHQAIEVLTSQPIDGVLVEYNLPGNGVIARNELKAIRPTVPVLLFSGVGSQTAFMVRFFDAYLRKALRFGDDAE